MLTLPEVFKEEIHVIIDAVKNYTIEKSVEDKSNFKITLGQLKN